MFNEAEIIERSLGDFVATLQQWHDAELVDAWEIVVVDDGSVDASPRLVQTLAETHTHIRLLTLGSNRGLGAGIRAGITAARYSHVLYTDADMPFDLGAMAWPLRCAATDPGRIWRAVRTERRTNGRVRAVYSVVYQRLIAAVFGADLRDLNFAGKLMPAAAVKRLDLRSEGSFIDAEILLRAQAAGIGVSEVTVVYQRRAGGRSTLSSLAVIAAMLQEMWRYRRTAGR